MTTPGGKPEMAEPGETPTLPLIIERPVLVTADPPRTAYDKAVPRLTWALMTPEKPRADPSKRKKSISLKTRWADERVW
jgi:hypothetical protein